MSANGQLQTLGVGVQIARRERPVQELRLRRHHNALMPAPMSSSNVPGSGTLLPLRENVALKGPWWVMSVPMRNQSGSRNSSRVQLCRSVEPRGKGVPGGTIGLGADSQKKFPFGS